MKVPPVRDSRRGLIKVDIEPGDPWAWRWLTKGLHLTRFGPNRFMQRTTMQVTVEPFGHFLAINLSVTEKQESRLVLRSSVAAHRRLPSKSSESR
jgi:hypothetical protein